MKLDFEFACDHLDSTNHSLLLELSSSVSCQHILTMFIHSCTYIGTLPLTEFCSAYEKQDVSTRPKYKALYLLVHWLYNAS